MPSTAAGSTYRLISSVAAAAWQQPYRQLGGIMAAQRRHGKESIISGSIVAWRNIIAS